MYSIFAFFQAYIFYNFSPISILGFKLFKIKFLASNYYILANLFLSTNFTEFQ